MTTLLIYELEGKEMRLKGRWEDGLWRYDKKSFSDIDHIDDHDAEMIMERFDGPYLYAVREEEAPVKITDIDLNFTDNGVEKEENVVSDFVQSKIDLANRHEDGVLDTSKYTDEQIAEIESYPWYDG